MEKIKLNDLKKAGKELNALLFDDDNPEIDIKATEDVLRTQILEASGEVVKDEFDELAEVTQNVINALSEEKKADEKPKKGTKTAAKKGMVKKEEAEATKKPVKEKAEKKPVAKKEAKKSMSRIGACTVALLKKPKTLEAWVEEADNVMEEAGGKRNPQESRGNCRKLIEVGKYHDFGVKVPQE